MTYLNEYSSRALAAVSALALSAIFMATAIVPAMPNVAAAGVLA